MRLYLFGGAEINIPSRSTALLKELLRKTLVGLGPKSVLHIPFARPVPIPEDNGEWDEGWLQNLMDDTDISILDARESQNLDKAADSIVFINGGPERINLLKTVTSNPKLLDLIKSAQYIVGESAGSMIMGEYMRSSRTDASMAKALGILKNVVIEPHYTEKNYKKYLPGDMEKSGMKYGIGIDSVTAIVVDPQKFPEKWEKIGVGNVYVHTV